MSRDLQPLTSPIRWPHIRRDQNRQSHATDRELGERRATILAVDDEMDALHFLQAFLAPEGFDILQAESGAQALSLIDERRPDLFIIDVMMPGMTGLELCDILRERAETRDIPIILYSAHDMKAHSNSGLYDHAFVKPADPDRLLGTIRALLPARRQ
jgi:DNA-binding response OmpR family regulator